MKKLTLLWTCFIISMGLAIAQTKQVSGRVVDKAGDAVIGASVVEDGTTNGVSTDLNGLFQLNIQPNSSIRVSYLGFVTQTINPGSRSNIEVILQEDTQMLDEVVVVAFGKMAREAFTGSAGVLKQDDLAKSQVSNAAQALAGRVAGLQLSTPSSQLHSSPSITIRGFSSISADTEPLYVVDGMPYDGDLNLINPNDIESMTVLKDAASNALYGARGANGVIMITTKRGQNAEAKVTLDAKWGLNTNGAQYYKTMNAQQFHETYYNSLYWHYQTERGGNLSAADAHALANSNLMNTSAGVNPGYMIYTVPEGQDFIMQGGKMNPKATLGTLYTYGDTKLWIQPDDWKKEGLQEGPRQEYNASVSGASGRTNYYTSLGWLDQEGVQMGQKQNRMTARVKLDYDAKSWLRIGTNINYTRYKYANTGEGTIGSGTLWAYVRDAAPIYPTYYRDANKNIMIDKWGEKMFDFAQSYGLSRAGGVGGNSIFGNKYIDRDNVSNSITASGYADIRFTSDLTLTINANAYDYNRKYTYISSPFNDYYTSSSNNGSVAKYSYNTSTYNLQQLLNYSKNINRHEITALAGHEYYNRAYSYLSASGYNFGIDGSTELSQMLQKNTDPYSYSTAYNNEGYIFRGMYNYEHKYYGSVSYRRDASSRFHKDHRWGNFWSLGGAWIVSKENFFNVSWVNSLKLKLSVGSQGNDNIGNFLYANTYNIVNNDNEVAYQWRQKGDKTITWETNTNWNAGLEFDLFKNRLNGSIDFFYRKTYDMLFSLKTPPAVGYTSYFVNLGDMQNKGIELVLNASIIKNKNFRWDANFNLSYVKNKVLRLPESVKSTTIEGYDGYINLDMSFVSKYKYYVAEGLPLYTWIMPKFAGIDSETGESLFYKDIIDENGKVTGRETTNNYSTATDYLIGDALAPLYGGIGTTLTYKGIDFSVNANYQIGGKVLDYNYQTLMHGGGRTATNWHVDVLKAWTPENKGSDIPRLLYSDPLPFNSSRSDRFLANASYINIQNVNLGYTLPSSLTRKIQIDNVRIYTSIENLAFFSMRRGLDPRFTLQGYINPEMSPPLRVISGGISLTF